MTERISLEKIQTAVGKAVRDALTESALHHGPIICGFIAPESLPAEEARKIADETAKAIGHGAHAVVEHAAAGVEGGRAAALPNRVIITGIRIDPNAVKNAAK